MFGKHGWEHQKILLKVVLQVVFGAATKAVWKAVLTTVLKAVLEERCELFEGCSRYGSRVAFDSVSEAVLNLSSTASSVALKAAHFRSDLGSNEAFCFEGGVRNMSRGSGGG